MTLPQEADRTISDAMLVHRLETAMRRVLEWCDFPGANDDDCRIMCRTISSNILDDIAQMRADEMESSK